MMETDDDFTGPVNIGNPGEFTILELAEKILKKIDTKSKIEYHELPSDDPTRRRPDITLAQEKLNWQPQIKLDEGLDKTINYYKNYI